MTSHQIGVLTSGHAPSEYLCEILQTWGIANYVSIPEETFDQHSLNDTPIVICAALDNGSSATVFEFAKQGGTVISCAPNDRLIDAINVETTGAREESILRLTVAGLPSFALGGQTLPIVGNVRNYRVTDDVNPLAYINEPLQQAGVENESAGIIDRRVGNGRIVQFAFDLQKSVQLLRQGDPANAKQNVIDRPSNLACDIGQQDAGWIPYADLLARLLIDVVCHVSSQPQPWLYHLPDGAEALVLYSGDEDGAALEANQSEFDTVAEANGRMNLYIIPEITNSSRSDVERYRETHDVGVHPDLTPLRQRNVTTAEIVEDFERQVQLFQDMYGFQPRTTRHHSTGWVGYLELVEAQERVGLEMDADYFSGHAFRDREHAPYSPFGAAMPMRFCHIGGKRMNVFQQHTQINDDVLLAPDRSYSYHLTTDVFSQMFNRMLVDAKTRLHVPITVNFHPGNWGLFSAGGGKAVLELAKQHDVPVWSLDQWLDFWKCRDTWRMTLLEWSGDVLTITASGDPAVSELRIAVPIHNGVDELVEISVNGNIAQWTEAVRFGARIALVELSEGQSNVEIVARYQAN